MKISIRSKLIVAISLLIAVLFSITAFLLVNEKEVELADDIFVNLRAYAKLSAPEVADAYDTYLVPNSFIYFNREISEILEQNDDVSGISVISYEGEILYDSGKDLSKKFEGEARLVDQPVLAQIQSENIGIETLNGEVVFLKEDEEGYRYVDAYEKEIEALAAGTLIEHIVIPVSDKYSILYRVSYENLKARVSAMQTRIIYLGSFGFILGILFALIMSGQVTRPVKKLVRGVEQIAKGDFSTRVDVKTHDEIKFLSDSFNKMAEDLEKSLEARVYKEKVAHELKLATDIQQRIIPKEIPETKGLDIAAGLIPAGAIGGDMYDFLKPDQSRLLMYLGDVTGHGVPAGIVSSLANALLFAYSAEPDIKNLMTEVNRVLLEKTTTNMFMTMCLLEWNENEQKMHYVNAGHEQIMVYRQKKDEVELLPEGGIALGITSDVDKKLKIEEVDLAEGDFLVIYSDGIPEAWRDDKESYGMERFKNAVKSFGNLQSAFGIKEAILADVEQFVGMHEQSDDITLIVIKRSA